MNTLTINFEGYWQCRQATDPDPSDDPRGVSGYTYAVGAESDLDLIIRLQLDEILPVDFRQRNLPNYPSELLKIRTGFDNMEDFEASLKTPEAVAEAEKQMFGIFVTSVEMNGESFEAGTAALQGGQVRWLPAGDQLGPDGKAAGPRYELRNEITYHLRQGIIMPIVPFDIRISSPDDKIWVQRFDPLDLANPDKEVWQLPMEAYSRRNPKNFFDNSSEVMEVMGFDPNSDPSSQYNDFFQKRKEWLELELSKATDPVVKSGLKNRLFALEFFTENQRIESKLGLKAEWDFGLHGASDVNGLEEALGISLDCSRPWKTRFWMGGFDGDVMRGYMRGALDIPCG